MNSLNLKRNLFLSGMISTILAMGLLTLSPESVYAIWGNIGNNDSKGKQSQPQSGNKASGSSGNKATSSNKQKTGKGTLLTKGEIKQMVSRHNYWRKKVGTQKMKWSAKLAKYAQNWANHLKKTKGCKMKHRQPNKYGENLYWAYNMKSSSKGVVDSWASERHDYTYSTNKCKPGKMCGHYTQVVWKSSKFVGCGKATCGAEEVWVCNYDPPGNYIGQKPW